MSNAGSWHDSAIAQKLYGLLSTHTSPYCIVADSAFPRNGVMAGKIMTPFKDGELSTDLDILAVQLVQHRYVLSIRQSAEWAMRALRSSFAILRLPLPADDTFRAQIISVCLHLHNLRTRLIGINQIKTVFSGTYENDDGIVYGHNNGGGRISRFYNISLP